LAIEYYKKAFKKNQRDILYKYESCLLTDQYYKNPQNVPKMLSGNIRSKLVRKRDYFSRITSKKDNAK